MKETISRNLIRYRKGLHYSQETLAERTGLTRQTINNYEKAKTLPDSGVLLRLSQVLGVTLDDLLRPPKIVVPTNFCFRAHGTFTQKPQFETWLLNILANYTALEMAVGFSPYVPESSPCHDLLGNEHRIQQIAQGFRARLGIGDAPIPNLFEAVEELGLKVLRLPVDQKGFFGVSACSATQGAFVLVNTHKISIERQLFTLAHEIGHLILHRDEYQDGFLAIPEQESGKVREQVADYFAAQLLMAPAAFEAARQNFGNDILKLKAYFRVSYAAILKRFDELGIQKYGNRIKVLRWHYKQQTGKSLTKDVELEPRLQESDFPVNQRYQTLIWQALKQEKISELKAAELLDCTVEVLRQNRQILEVYSFG